MPPFHKSPKHTHFIDPSVPIFARSSIKRLVRKSGAYYHNQSSLTPTVNAGATALLHAILSSAATIATANNRSRFSSRDINDALNILHLPIVL